MAQEAAVRAFLHIRRRGASGENLDPLLHRIARNMLIDRRRRGGPEMVALDHIEPVGDPAQDPAEHVEARQKDDALRDAVGTLPDRHRDAIVYALDGMTSAQIGERMGIGTNAADALLHRARRRLRDRLHTIGETAFGLAVLARTKLQSMRSGAVQPGLSEAGTSLLAGGVGAAAALAVALTMGSPAGASTGKPTIGKPAAVSVPMRAVSHRAPVPEPPVTITVEESAPMEISGPGASVVGPGVTAPGGSGVGAGRPPSHEFAGVNYEPACRASDKACRLTGVTDVIGN